MSLRCLDTEDHLKADPVGSINPIRITAHHIPNNQIAFIGVQEDGQKFSYCGMVSPTNSLRGFPHPVLKGPSYSALKPLTFNDDCAGIWKPLKEREVPHSLPWRRRVCKQNHIG